MHRWAVEHKIELESRNRGSGSHLVQSQNAHSEGESLGMGGEKRLGRKGPPQFGDQWGSLTSKSVG